MAVSDYGLSGFPSQKRSLTQKGESWRKKCVQSAIDHAFSATEFKTNYSEMRANIDLYNNRLDTKEMMEFCDPFALGSDSFPIKPRNYPIAAPKINLLVGEEAKRVSDFRVKIVNEDAVSQKEKEIKDRYMKTFMEEIIQNPNIDEATIEKKIKDLEKWRKYEYQDIRERRATHLLEHIKHEEKVDKKFNDGFLDALLTGLEIYAVDIVGGEPSLRKCNPLNIKTIRTSESNQIEDCDIIVEYAYYSPGKIIDMFHDHLKPSQVSMLERGKAGYSADDDKSFITLGEKEPDLPAINLIENSEGNLVASDEMSDTSFHLPEYTSTGSILVTRAVWRSYQKVGRLKYYDEVTGDVQYKLVSEFYEPDTALGEEVKWYWVTDWWEGTRIGRDIYVKMQAFPIKAYSMSNPSISQCPYIGSAYSVNDDDITSLMGRMKPYQYLYNAFMWKTQDAFAKYKGVIGTIDLARTPDGWEFEDVLYYAERMGWMVEDSFKEGDKGAATGKLAGNLPGRSTPMDFNLSGYIQQNLAMLNFLKVEMGEISGVSKQREGSIHNRELVGNVDRSVTQSSHITEVYFSMHEDVKKRTLTALLEAAKFAYKGKKKIVQHILDDMSSEIFELDGDHFRELDFGIVMSNNLLDAQMRERFIQLAQAGLQSDKLNFSQLMDIMTDRSISSMRRKIETAEEDAIQRQQQQQERQLQAGQQQQQQQIEANMAMKRMEMQHETDLQTSQNEKDLAIERLKQAFKAESEDVKRLKVEYDKMEKDMDREHEARQKELDRQAKLAVEATKQRTK